MGPMLPRDVVPQRVESRETDTPERERERQIDTLERGREKARL